MLVRGHTLQVMKTLVDYISIKLVLKINIPGAAAHQHLDSFTSQEFTDTHFLNISR